MVFSSIFWFLNFCKNLFLFSWLRFLVTSSIFLRSWFFFPLRIPLSLFFSFWMSFIDLTALSSLDMLMFLLSARLERFFLPLPRYAWLICALSFLTSFIVFTSTPNFRFRAFYSRALRRRSVSRTFSEDTCFKFFAFWCKAFMLRGFALKFVMIALTSFVESLRSSWRWRRRALSFSCLN